MIGKTKRTRRAPLLLAPLALAAVAAAAVFYGKAPGPGKGEPECSAASKAIAARLAPLAKGDIAALAVAAHPRHAPDLTFKGPDGKMLTLADFKGKALVLNLWATWCVPCRAEMPALDRLEAKAGADDFEVVAVNVDTARLERAPAFLDEIGVKSLKRYSDSTANSFETLRLAGKALGLPTSLMIDKYGCELGVVAGPANWDAPDAAAAIGALEGG